MIRETLTNNALLKKQITPLFKATLAGGLANIFSACLVFILFNNSPQESQAIVLSTAIIFFSVIRIFISEHYLKYKNNGIKLYIYSHVFLTLLIGIAWAGYAYMQIEVEADSLRNFVILINFGLIAASIATLSTLILAYLVYIVPQSIAIFYVFLNQDSNYSLYMGAAFIIYTTLMITTSLQFNRRFIRELDLKFKNKTLILDLNEEVLHREQAQIELEKNKHELEIKVEERTRDLVEINTNLENVITKKEQAEDSLQHLAYHDELTGLPNKNLLVDRIKQSLKISTRNKQQLAILFLDLDRFKNINDSLGHTIGDKLLQEVASRLYTTLRSHDTISRNGGDEFVIVLERLKNSSQAIYVAKKVITCLTDTFEIGSHKIHIGASIGISLYPGDGETPLTLLRNADTAMYRAKQAGGNQLQFYDKSMSNQLRNRLELENELHSALLNDEFYMVYQPQINCTTNETTGFESLIRWNNSKYGEIPPDRFIPLLEETGLIYSVGEWIVRQVISFVSSHNTKNVCFSINLSALQCSDLGFVKFVENEIHTSGISPSQIEFEITETLLIKDFDKTKLFLKELHSIGCAIALDDFGTGYTSMSYLARLPIDIIKIDKSLIRNINNNDSLRSIVRAIVTMSKSLGMKNIFEGIETTAELEEIKLLNGSIIQGFLFSKPLNAIDVEQWLQQLGTKIKHA
ncbi:diguanylate cyclase/phosphodiesterase (GGDEF & EAL domains) with PAS/PAC sensor(s) [hydrothermal vent metagenome]|uniref:Diguanylate cyclase/phosphodiesterase (GGDEF & EAL domains) with PAS/PAC sensor(S) n=1 Tax=hydrothermal vent metagenome TaxID=652676 RepID=A0A3B0WKB6_9ZZZZ